MIFTELEEDVTVAVGSGLVRSTLRITVEVDADAEVAVAVGAGFCR